MDRVPTPKDMNGAAGVAVSLAYAAGLAGVIAGTVVFQRGEPVLGVVVLVITFAVGAALMIASYLVRGLAAVLAHVARLEADVRVLLGDSGRRRREEHEDLTGGWD